MKALRVAFVVDHPQRDLAGLALTAARLSAAGVECSLVPLNRQEQELWAIAPDLVVLNYARPGNQRLAEQLLDAGIRLVVLDTEGGVWPDTDSYTSLLWSDAALRRRVSRVAMWGPELAGRLVTDGWFTPEQVTVTGCPRFDFYQPPWKSVLDVPRRSEGPRVLVNTNFYTVNCRFVDEARNRRQLCDELGWSEAAADGLIRREHAAREAVSVLVVELARELNATIALRPHPFEDPEWYRARFAGVERVSVEPDGPVQPALFAADALVQRSCTTALEAALAGVPAFSPRWIAAPMEMPMAEAVSVGCADSATLIEELRRVLGGGWSRPPGLEAAVDSTIERWFFRADGSAHERVAAVILAALPAHRVVDAAACRRRLYGLSEQESSWRVAGRRVRYHLGLSPHWSFRRFRRVNPGLYRHKRIPVGEVAGLLGRISLAAPRAGGDVGVDRQFPGRVGPAHSVRLAPRSEVILSHG